MRVLNPTSIRRLLVSTAAAATAGVGIGVADAVQDDAAQVDQRWLDKLDETDRTLIGENIGYAPPRITEKMRAYLKWHGVEALSWDELRGKVVVVQSWTSKTSAGRSAPMRTERTLARYDSDQYMIIAIHTPEGADNVDRFLQQRQMSVPIVVDTKGYLLDELGMFRRPTNVVIDRNGTVRYGGLNARGLQSAVGVLIEEPFDPSATPRPRSDEPAEPKDAKVDFPRFNSSVGSATNIQGKRAPDLFVQRWLNGRPAAKNKVVIVDFWATWCPPCVRSIPHMNGIANRFRDDLVAIGISNEKPGTVQNFMRKTRMDYAVAVDQGARMQKAVGVRGIPHVIVISSDWVVRWQGHPATLTEQMVATIVEANRQLVGNAGGGGVSRHRWTGA